MSQENLQLFRTGLDAFNRRDRAAFLAFCHPDYENVPPREWPESAPLRGPDAIWDFFISNMDPWAEGSLEVGEVIDAGNDKVVGEQWAEVRGQSSGIGVAWRYWHVMTIRDRKAVRSEWFADRSDALEAAGLEE